MEIRRDSYLEQFMPRFEEVLNSLLHIKGRGDEIRIYPLYFAEFYAAFDGDYEMPTRQ